VIEVVEAVMKVVELVLKGGGGSAQAVNGVRCVLWVLGVMLCILLYILFCKL